MKNKPTKEQLRALLAIYNRETDKPKTESFLQFRRRAVYDNLNQCLMIAWCNMYLGIEKDGYTHS